jgi:hypothetical protein
MSNSRSDHFSRAYARRSLVQFASVLVLTMLVTGLLALYSIWSMNRQHERTEQTLLETAVTIDLARSAQVRFKIEVQEWKNFLLRGSDAADRATYLKAFSDNSAAVRALLVELSHRPDPDPVFSLQTSAEQLLAAHGALDAAYATASSAADDQHWNPVAMDRAVRGIDRPLNQQLDSLADRLTAQLDVKLRDSKVGESRRFAALTRAIWIAMLLTIALVGLLIWRVFGERVRQS